MLLESGCAVPALTPSEAAGILAGLVDRHDFVLYEYFLTDAAAHGRIARGPAEVLIEIDALITALLGELDLERHGVLLCSDHGNIEDSSVRGHTRNPVPLLAWGAGAEALVTGVRGISGIAGAVESYFRTTA